MGSDPIAELRFVLVEIKAALIGFTVGTLAIAGVALATGRGDHSAHVAPASIAHDWPAKRDALVSLRASGSATPFVSGSGGDR